MSFTASAGANRRPNTVRSNWPIVSNTGKRNCGKMYTALKANEFQHSKIKEVSGSCGSSWAICDLLDEHELTMALLKYPQSFRILAPNEAYYIEYDKKGSWIEELWEAEDEGDYELE